MTSVHIAHADVVEISNRLYQRHNRAWIVLLNRAQREGITLLALLYTRIRALRDAGARKAFETKQPECVVYWHQREFALAGLTVLQGQVLDIEIQQSQVLDSGRVRPLISLPGVVGGSK